PSTTTSSTRPATNAPAAPRRDPSSATTARSPGSTSTTASTAASGTSSPPKPRAGRPQDQVRGTTRPARSQTRHTADARRYDWDHDGMRRHRAAATLLTLGLTLAATACGGGNDDGPPAATEPPADNADTE